MKSVLSVLLVCSFIGHAVSINAILKTWGTCEGKHYKTYVHVYNFKHLGNYVHKIDVNVSAEMDLGANLKYSTVLYKNNKKMPLNLSGKDVCKGLYTVLGDVADQILNNLHPKVDKCPIKKGFYTARGITIDAKAIKAPVPIKGNFKVQVPVNEISNNKEMACIEITAELQ